MFKVLSASSLLFTTANAGGASTCASAWKSTGGGNCQLAVAICLAESGGNTHARNVNSDSHHSVDRGLWQVNNYWHPEVSDTCAYSANCNANAAKSISSGGSNWSPWSTYHNGAYHGKVARFDLATFSQVQALDLTATDPDLKGFQRGFASGSYGYFVPNYNGVTEFGKVARVGIPQGPSFRPDSVGRYRLNARCILNPSLIHTAHPCSYSPADKTSDAHPNDGFSTDPHPKRRSCEPPTQKCRCCSRRCTARALRVLP